MRLGLVLAGILCLSGISEAQSTRQEHTAWRARRASVERTLEAVDRAAAGVSKGRVTADRAKATGPLTLVGSRWFTDAFGNAVVVGEVRNDTTAVLSFSKAVILFYNGATFVDADFSYVHGSRNGRLALTGIYTDVLPPGEIGFFKVWTNLPANQVDFYEFQAEANVYDLTPVYSTVALASGINLAGNGLGFTDYSGTLRNTSASFTTYFTQVSLAGYSGGTINDVGFTYASAGSATVCGISGIPVLPPATTGSFSSYFLRPVSAIARVAIGWDEYGILSSAQSVGAPGGSVSTTVIANCEWTAVSNVPWITVTSAPNGSADAVVTFTVQANPGVPRGGTLTIAGQTFTVTQAGLSTCNFTVESPASVAGSAGSGTVNVTAPAGCAWTAVSQVPWLTIGGGATGSGSGTVAFTFTANPTRTRAPPR